MFKKIKKYLRVVLYSTMVFRTTTSTGYTSAVNCVCEHGFHFIPKRKNSLVDLLFLVSGFQTTTRCDLCDANWRCMRDEDTFPSSNNNPLLSYFWIRAINSALQGLCSSKATTISFWNTKFPLQNLMAKITLCQLSVLSPKIQIIYLIFQLLIFLRII